MLHSFSRGMFRRGAGRRRVRSLRSSESIERLTAALSNPDVQMRRAAVDGLARGYHEQRVPLLIEALRSDPSLRVRMECARALGRMEDRAAHDALVECVRDPDEWRPVCLIAMEGLSRAPTPEAVEALVGRLGDGGVEVRRTAVRMLGRIGERRAVPELATRLRDDSEVLEVRLAVLNTLSSIGGRDALATLIEALDDRSTDVRVEAARYLGEHRHRRAAAPLLAALERDCEAVRREAARALGRIGASEAVDPLVRTLGDRDPGVRYTAAEALECMGPVAIEPVASTLAQALTTGGKATDWGMQGCRRWTSACCHAAELLQRLCGLLPEADAQVRMASLRALAAAVPVWGERARLLRGLPFRVLVDVVRLLEVAMPLVEAAGAAQRHLLTPADEGEVECESPGYLRPSDADAETDDA